MAARIVFIICVFAYFSTVIVAQSGTDCRSDIDCFSNQICNFGYCQCIHGYVKYIQHCFPLRGHDEECFFEEECKDFRMVCATRLGDPESIKRCICDRYHEWSSETNECEQASNLTEIVSSLKEETKWAEEIEENGRKVFTGLLIAGLLVITIGFVMATLCTIYGCCFKGTLPRPTEEDVEKPKVHDVASTGSAQGTYIPIPIPM